MTGICPACKQPMLPGAVACTRPDCLRRLGLFDQGTIITPLPPAAAEGPGLFAQATLNPSATISDGRLTIPGYEVVREIGRGGMGVVVEGKQLSLDRRVAIKLLPPHLATSADFVQRFQREANTLARLSHPNIVNVIDRGQHDALFYFVMEYVQPPGGDRPSDLRQLILSGQLDAAATHRLFLQIARALDYAHKQGVIHRDVKPTNILLDQHHNARVTDFGIAAVVGERGQRQEQLTAAGVGMGTSDYMAPEQRFDAANIDHRADVYSAGVMLYEMLTGSRPTFEYLPPSRAVPGLNPGWDAVVARALKTRAQDRYADMAEFATAVEFVGVVNDNAAPEMISAGPAPFPVHAAPAQRTPLPTGTAPGTAPGVACLDCGAVLRPGEAYCPGCGLPTAPECPTCGTRSNPGQRYCASCRTDLQRAPRCESYRQQGNQMLAAAEADGDSAERIGRAEKAQEAFQAGLQLIPNHRGLSAALARSRTLLLRLLLQAGDRAVQEKNLPQARILFERVLAVQPDHSVAAKRLKDLDGKRNDEIAQASELLNRGQFGPAAQALERLRQRCPADPQVAALVRSTRQHETLLRQALETTAPRLEHGRRFVELLGLLVDLQRRNLEVPNGQLELCRTKLTSVKDLVRSGQEARANGDEAQAAECARQALQVVADHPVALRLLDLSPDGSPVGGRPRRVLRGVGRFFKRLLVHTTVCCGIVACLGGAALFGGKVYLDKTAVQLSPPSGPPPTHFWNQPEAENFTWTVPAPEVTPEHLRLTEFDGMRYHAVPDSQEPGAWSCHAFRGKFTPTVARERRQEVAGDSRVIARILGLRDATVTSRDVKNPTWAKKEFICRGSDGRVARLRYYLDRNEGVAYYFWVSSSDPARLEAADVARFFDQVQAPWVSGRD